ncbi:hypothetical protein BD560DRAFT_440099 [Blakeslea trispora]|nr:hypothetical protein BD560DRAFT_440099 [Blakeslea trispora]
MVTMDGNFQLKRKSNSSAAQYRIRTAEEEELWGTSLDVKKYEDDDNEEVEDLDSQFKAVKKHERTLNGRYDVNGVFAMSCARHGALISFFDIKGGEDRKYALAFVESFLKTRPKEKAFPSLASCNTHYAVLIFHAPAHNMHCQMQYNPKYIDHFGLTDGEGIERFWSYTIQFIAMTRSMSKDRRQLLLTDATIYYAEEKMKETRKGLQQFQATAVANSLGNNDKSLYLKAVATFFKLKNIDLAEKRTLNAIHRSTSDKQLKDYMEAFEAKFGVRRPNNLEDPLLAAHIEQARKIKIDAMNDLLDLLAFMILHENQQMMMQSFASLKKDVTLLISSINEQDEAKRLIRSLSIEDLDCENATKSLGVVSISDQGTEFVLQKLDTEDVDFDQLTISQFFPTLLPSTGIEEPLVDLIELIDEGEIVVEDNLLELE